MGLACSMAYYPVKLPITCMLVVHAGPQAATQGAVPARHLSPTPRAQSRPRATRLPIATHLHHPHLGRVPSEATRVVALSVSAKTCTIIVSAPSSRVRIVGSVLREVLDVKNDGAGFLHCRQRAQCLNTLRLYMPESPQAKLLMHHEFPRRLMSYIGACCAGSQQQRWTARCLPPALVPQTAPAQHLCLRQRHRPATAPAQHLRLRQRHRPATAPAQHLHLRQRHRPAVARIRSQTPGLLNVTHSYTSPPDVSMMLGITPCLHALSCHE